MASPSYFILTRVRPTKADQGTNRPSRRRRQKIIFRGIERRADQLTSQPAGRPARLPGPSSVVIKDERGIASSLNWLARAQLRVLSGSIGPPYLPVALIRPTINNSCLSDEPFIFQMMRRNPAGSICRFILGNSSSSTTSLLPVRACARAPAPAHASQSSQPRSNSGRITLCGATN